MGPGSVGCAEPRGHTRDLPCVCRSVRCRTGVSQAYQQGGCSLPPQTPIVGQTLACIWPRREDELSFLILEGKKHKPVEIHFPVPPTGSFRLSGLVSSSWTNHETQPIAGARLGNSDGWLHVPGTVRSVVRRA